MWQYLLTRVSRDASAKSGIRLDGNAGIRSARLSGGPCTGCGASRHAQHCATATSRSEAMEIGEPERTYTVEPLEDPVPREVPAEPAEPSPAEEPAEPEQVEAP
jgi:hypothetical protein